MRAGALEASGVGERTRTEGWSLRESVMWAFVLAGLATLLPLYDPDLPMHLALGEWIVQHRSVPVVEPFAWTREGSPYFAYSWLPETLFYLVHRAVGPAGLRLLQGLLMGAVFLAAVVSGRMMGWRHGPSFLIGGFSALVAAIVTPSLRPQIVLLILTPLAWALVHRAQRGAPLRSTIPWLLLIGAVAGNSHLFFPITIAPVALLLTSASIPWRIVLITGASIAAGWLITPYLFEWPEMLRVSLASNAIMEWPSPVAELQPGFVAVARLEHVIALPAILLTLLPWITASLPWPLRTRLLAAAYWIIGLVAFGFALRLLLLWWLLVLPFAGHSLHEMTVGESDAPPRLLFRLIGYVGLIVLLVLSASRSYTEWTREGDVNSRRLASVYARSAEPIAMWLEQNTRPDASGRIFTVFNFGSYLTWRLPSFSSSMDSRGIFPDSVALAEVLVPAGIDSTVLGPWRSADLAIVPLNRRVATVLDTAAGWRRVAEVVSDRAASESAALWVSEAWWRTAGTTSLPSHPIRLQIVPVDMSIHTNSGSGGTR